MKQFKKIFTIIGLTLILSLSRLNEASAEEVRILTLEESLTIAAERNHDILRAREYIEWSQGKYVEERSVALPQLTITSSVSRDRDDSQKELDPSLVGRQTLYNTNIGLTQPLFTWGQISAAIRAAESGMQSAEEQLRLSRQTARRDVSEAFYDVLMAKDLHKIALDSLEQKKNRLDEARRKYDAGLVTDYDVLAAKVAMENECPNVIRAENQVRTARDRLRYLLGLEGEDVDVTGSLDIIIDTYPSHEETFAVALEHRPELADFRHRQSMSEEFVRIADAQDKPRLDLKGDYGWRKLDTDINDESESGTTRESIDSHGEVWSVGLLVSYPIFDGLATRGKVAQARSNLRSLQIEEKKQTETIELQVRQAVNNVHEAGEIVKALSGTVSQAEQLRTMADKGYELGVKIRLEVEDAELNLSQAKANLSRAQRDYLVSRVNLQWTMGVLGEDNPSGSN